MGFHSSRQAFAWDDPLALDAQLTADERAIRDAARSYCQDRLLPRVQDAFRHERTDAASFREMGEIGLLGPTTYEGTHDVHALILGRAIIGIAAFN